MSTLPKDDCFYLARKAQALQLRAGFTEHLRRFFIQQGFLEVETPLRIPAPAPEVGGGLGPGDMIPGPA